MFGFFIGGLLGALVLFFLGTKDGKKTKKLLEERGKKFFEEMGDKLGDYEEKGKELIAEGEELKEEVLEQIAEKKEDVTADVSKKLDTALAHIEAMQERGRETTAQLRKRLFKNLPKKS